MLAVSAVLEEQLALRDLFRHTKWHLLEAAGCAEALGLLRRRPIAVVLCDTVLPDGNWKDLLGHVQTLGVPPLVIVASRLADDRLWSEVLELGGYDLLEKPFDSSEMYRVISLAWLYWKNRRAPAPGGVRVANG